VVDRCILKRGVRVASDEVDYPGFALVLSHLLGTVRILVSNLTSKEQFNDLGRIEDGLHEDHLGGGPCVWWGWSFLKRKDKEAEQPKDLADLSGRSNDSLFYQVFKERERVFAVPFPGSRGTADNSSLFI
jgi:hypothetical protein